MVFLLPVEAGEKIGLSITVLLSFSFLLTVVQDATPENGESLPIISKFSDSIKS